MKLLLSLFCLSIIGLQVQSMNRGPSDLEVGTPTPSDTVLDYAWANRGGTPGQIAVTPVNRTFVTNTRINYIRATEYGFNPNARVKLVDGGPGYNYVSLSLNSTVAGAGYTYMIHIFGTR